MGYGKAGKQVIAIAEEITCDKEVTGSAKE